MSFIPDMESDLRENDQFNSLKYAETLAAAINESPKQSFAIGLFGEWGSGKSSIVRTAQSILESQKKGKKYHFYTYDAWKYSNDSFRRTFLINLANSAGLEGKDLFKSFYEVKTETHPIKTKINYPLLGFIGSLFLIVIFMSVLDPVKDSFRWTLQTILTLATIAISLSANYAKEYIGSRQTPLIFSPEQFEECFDELLSKILKKRKTFDLLMQWFNLSSKVSSVDQLVIVLDNLDRCEQKIAYELLSDFKNFLGKDGVLFIVPVDDSALRNHISSVSGTKEDADEFLRKIFNNTLKIKPYKTQDLFTYTQNLSEKYELNLLPDTIDVIAKEYATNPRRIIQFLNGFVTEKEYLIRRKGVSFVKEHETLVALILLVRDEWPSLYQKFSDALYKLANLEQALELAETDEQRVFLRKTHPHTVNVNEKILRDIFSNQDQNPYVSDSLITAVLSRDTETVKEFLASEKQKGINYLAEYFLQDLKDSVGRKVVASLSNTFNALAFLNGLSELSKTINKRVLGELSADQDWHLCMANFDNTEAFVKYLNSLEHQQLPKPTQILLRYLNELIQGDSELDNTVRNEPLLAERWSELIKAFAVSDASEATLKGLRKAFFVVYRDEDFDLCDLKIDSKSLKLIVGENLANLAAARDDFLNEGRHIELSYLVKNEIASPKTIESWTNRFSDHLGSLNNLTKDVLKTKFSLVEEIFSLYKNTVDEKTAQRVIDLMFIQRVTAIPGQGSRQITYINEISQDLDALNHAIKLICWVYVRTKGNANAANRLIEIAALHSDAEELVLNNIKWIHEDQGFTLAPLHKFLEERGALNNALLDIYRWMLVEKRNNDYVLKEEASVEKILKKCINAILTSEDSSRLEELFVFWVADERIKRVLASIVSGLTRENILSLPKVIQESAYASISTSDNIYEFSDDTELLLAMNKQANTKFNKQIEKVIIHNLTKDESFVKGLELLEQLETLNGMKKSSIVNYLEEKRDDSELGARVEACIDNIQKAQ